MPGLQTGLSALQLTEQDKPPAPSEVTLAMFLTFHHKGADDFRRLLLDSGSASHHHEDVRACHPNRSKSSGIVTASI